VVLSKLLTPRKMMEVVRTHWSIENHLHWTLDVVFDEDGARSRKNYAPRTSPSSDGWRSISSEPTQCAAPSTARCSAPPDEKTSSSNSSLKCDSLDLIRGSEEPGPRWLGAGVGMRSRSWRAKIWAALLGLRARSAALRPG